MAWEQAINELMRAQPSEELRAAYEEALAVMPSAVRGGTIVWGRSACHCSLYFMCPAERAGVGDGEACTSVSGRMQLLTWYRNRKPAAAGVMLPCTCPLYRYGPPLNHAFYV